MRVYTSNVVPIGRTGALVNRLYTKSLSGCRSRLRAEVCARSRLCNPEIQLQSPAGTKSAAHSRDKVPREDLQKCTLSLKKSSVIAKIWTALVIFQTICLDPYLASLVFDNLYLCCITSWRCYPTSSSVFRECYGFVVCLVPCCLNGAELLQFYSTCIFLHILTSEFYILAALINFQASFVCL